MEQKRAEGRFQRRCSTCRIQTQAHQSSNVGYMYFDTGVQTFKVLTSVQTQLSMHIRTPPRRRPGATAIAPKVIFR